MKVLMFGRWPEDERGGGVAQYTAQLTERLAQETGIEISFVSFGTRNVQLRLGNLRINVIRISMLYRILPFLAIARLLLEIPTRRPDIVHIQGSNLSPYSFVAIILSLKYPTIITVHNIQSREWKALGRTGEGTLLDLAITLHERTVLNRATRIITVTNELRDWIAKRYESVRSDKLSVIPGGVASDNLKPTDEMMRARSSLGIPPEAFVIVHAKALTNINGQLHLINALPLIRQQVATAILVLAGTGDDERALRQASVRQSVERHVKFLGEISHTSIPSLIASADVVAIPSVRIADFQEGSSLFLLEAMSMAKPVVASAVGGLRESIADGETGILIACGDEKKLAEAIILLAGNPRLSKRIGRNARTFVQEQRDWTIISRLVRRQYDEAICGCRRPRSRIRN